MSNWAWIPDGSIGAVEYLETTNDQIYASVDILGCHVGQCQIWTPGCGLEPLRTQHASIEEAKRHSEEQLSLMGMRPKGAQS
jgi:hypothetical protein